MKLFACDRCQQIVFFESVSCTRCGQRLAYLPDRELISALAPDADGTTWRAPDGAAYRLCQNQLTHEVCNWAVPVADPTPFCRACRLNDVIPNLSEPGAKDAWQRMEIAKRRLLYTLLDLGLPVEGKAERPEGGLAFAFLKDVSREGGPRIYTGHANGLVTINVAEADDPSREKTRIAMGEAYRTLLGHFRHEIGHYYWDRLVRDTEHQEPFRALFGDERADYAEAQQRHYDAGPPTDWAQRFVTAYASMHPWEDWAETWAHYLHMTDTVETASAHGLALRPDPDTAPQRRPTLNVRRVDLRAFDELLNAWVPITIALNNLNRSMGLPDPYPFVLSDSAIAKLRFVHGVIAAARA